MFIINKDDKLSVQAGLTQLRKADADEIKKLPRRFFHRRCRRTIPPPSLLAARLHRVIKYGQALKMADGRPLYKSGKGGMARVHKLIIKEVLDGHVSDSPNIELYRLLKQNEKGWNVYAVARGSSALEGFHRHLCLALAGFRVGAELADCILLEMLVRWNMHCAVRHLSHVDYGVADPELLDALWDVTQSEVCKGASISELSNYDRTVLVLDAELEDFGASR